ncbi:MAG: hypothetical protein ACYDGN_05225 [Acidimicrobiales bacterium]
MAKSTVPFFRLSGFVGSQQVSAEWRDGYLSADEELMEIADGLVKNGELFRGDGIPVVAAGLDDPLALVLTLARAFDRITKATVELGAGQNEEIESVIRSFGSFETAPAGDA